MCTETSPRTSFSRDLNQSDFDPPVEHQEMFRRDTSLLLDSNSEFEFRICRNSDQELYPADEIFSNGVILPFERVQRERSSVDAHSEIMNIRVLSPIVSVNKTQNAGKESENEDITIVDSSTGADHHPKNPRNYSKSFWNFKRSLSLNRDMKKSLVFSFPLLSRSNSTGSVKRPETQTLKDFPKQSSVQKQVPRSGPRANSSFSSSSSSFCCDVYRLITRKPPGKKHGSGGFRFIPVLTVPPLYVSKFGFESVSRNSKEKKMNKK